MPSLPDFQFPCCSSFRSRDAKTPPSPAGESGAVFGLTDCDHTIPYRWAIDGCRVVRRGAKEMDCVLTLLWHLRKAVWRGVRGRWVRWSGRFIKESGAKTPRFPHGDAAPRVVGRSRHLDTNRPRVPSLPPTAGPAGMYACGGGCGPRHDRVRRARFAEFAVVSPSIPRLAAVGSGQ